MIIVFNLHNRDYSVLDSCLYPFVIVELTTNNHVIQRIYTHLIVYYDCQEQSEHHTPYHLRPSKASSERRSIRSNLRICC